MATPAPPPPPAYLLEEKPDDPQWRLGLGAADEIGKRDYGAPQTTYDGWVSALQEDLWAFGFRADFSGGLFDAALEEQVVCFQIAAGRTKRGNAREPVEPAPDVTPSGLVDGPTRREILRWKKFGWTWPREQLLQDAVETIFAWASHFETGRELHGRREMRKDPVSGLPVGHYVPGAFELAEVHPKNGMRVGWLAFDQRSGWLGRLLAKVYSSDPKLLDVIENPAQAYNVARARTDTGRMAESLGPPERWRQFCTHPAIETIQIHVLWDAILRPLYEAAARNRIRTVRGLALLCEVARKIDLDTAVFVADACGKRDLRRPVLEHLEPGMLALAHLTSGGRAHFMKHFRALLAAPNLDEVDEYFWDVQFHLLEKGPAPDSLG